jgi:hypothetical protein
MNGSGRHLLLPKPRDREACCCSAMVTCYDSFVLGSQVLHHSDNVYSVPLDVFLDPYFTVSKCEDLVDQDQSTLV